eukprot:gnl/TRDRNA2_/TRDRNA2_172393_c4_seq2.p1 gnl/TRDRNA2_/TRDRNA2_172393_c4~~gnl/TRDRNA2_/TRDRNA2_172393_c4_seq2.p1  ORF type:complete len:311 (+),score=34.16 gnl/TRDRNA2_/TRDRNA2_172393_c4_seq2:115-1047(+)
MTARPSLLSLTLAVALGTMLLDSAVSARAASALVVYTLVATATATDSLSTSNEDEVTDGVQPSNLALAERRSHLHGQPAFRVAVDCKELITGSWFLPARLLSTGTTETPESAALTNELTQAATIQALLCTLHAHQSQLSDIHVSACWSSLGTLARENPTQVRSLEEKVGDGLKLLLQYTTQAVKDGRLGTRELANVAYNAACLGGVGSLSELFGELGTSATGRVNDFSAEELANITWAFSTVNQFDETLFTAVARAMEKCIGDFNVQSLVNTAWAFATADQCDDKLFAALATPMERRVGDFSAQNLANML